MYLVSYVTKKKLPGYVREAYVVARDPTTAQGWVEAIKGCSYVDSITLLASDTLPKSGDARLIL